MPVLAANEQISASAKDAMQQRHAAAVGAARLMRQEFEAWAALMQDRLKAGVYVKEPIRVATELDVQTRLLVASAVDRRIWDRVAAAASNAPKAQRLINRYDVKIKLLPEDVVRASALAVSFGAASDALEPLAEETP